MSQPAPSIPPDDRLTRFSDRSGTYAKHRPSYPPGAIDAVLSGLGEPSGLMVLDVGAGTGISSRLLADRGCRVVALEPNAAMRGAAEEHPRVEFVDGTGEETGRRDGEFDVVSCFQAFHWLHHARALREFVRVLKPGGRAALVWNVRDTADPFTRAYGEVILKHASDPPTSPYLGGGGHVPLEFRVGWKRYRVEVVPSEQSLDLPGLIGRATSASYCPNAGACLEALSRDLSGLFARYSSGDRVKLRYRCEVHVADSPGPCSAR